MQPQAVFVRCCHAAGVDAIAADHILYGPSLVAVGQGDIEVVIRYNLDIFWDFANFHYSRAAENR
jgi:hypothetical protein